MDYQRKKVDGVEVLYSADWIHDLETSKHFNWYWHQACIVYTHCDRTQHLLEIGVGTNLLADLLKRRGWQVDTLDIDENKSPDYCGSAAEFDYSSHHVNVVLAFEVFEHIPLKTFEKVIDRLAESQVSAIHFSLPWNERALFTASIKLPRVRELRFGLSVPRGRITTKAHFWELAKSDKLIQGKQLLSLQALTSIVERRGFVLTPRDKIGCIQYFSAIRGD
ncbi:class I SAM-dependent methyltransferase [Congregibacter brevis]|uniref:Class I SAM-dependent methyltransferase n=1 Tax=Congregibacter brevis TaxID=3081201 RepID=A0ABZ0ID11_9GAMM|nr:class I SAM-dependent methyltransferase [Congregibacter sp. IMCC45268]